MSSVSFLDLLDSSIRDSNRAAVDFSSLYRLLHALLTHLGIRDLILRSGLPMDQPGTDPEPVAELEEESLRGRVQKCEDELTRVKVLLEMKNQEQTREAEEVKELQEQMKEMMLLQEQVVEVKELREQMQEFQEQRKEMEELEEPMKIVMLLQEQMKEVKEFQEEMKEVRELQEPSKLVEVLQEQMKELQERAQEVTDIQEQMKETCVTWEVLHAGLVLGQQVEPLDTRESRDVPVGLWGTQESGLPGSSLQTLEVLRDLGRLLDQRLDQRVKLLEERRSDQNQLVDRGSLVTDRLSKDLEQQRSLIDSLMKQQTDLTRSLQDLEQKTSTRPALETELKVDQMVLDSKVSQRDFDSVTEQLNSMFHELLNRVLGQEQNWQQLMERLSSEMDYKLNRLELDSVKKQLEDRWKKIQSKLQTQEEPENQDAAGLRKQLIDRFHCLSCDRPIAKLSPGTRLVTLPSSPGLPSHKSMRPFTVYALEQFRHHYRSNGVSAAADQVMSRKSGRSHTAASGGQRRTKQSKHQTEAELQSEEVDIVGLDGHVYRGRLNASLETKLPNISGKDGSCKTEDRSRSSTHRSESRGSCGSGRPRSVLGCPSQGSILETHTADLLDPTPFQM